MTPARFRLKHRSGWFAAGEEVAQALEILSAPAFKLYLYLCLQADRDSGRIAWEPDEAAHLFEGGAEEVRTALEELYRQQVCLPRAAGVLEMADRFWPYEKPAPAEPAADLAAYVRQVRQMLLRPACVRVRFSAADERLAANFHRRGIPLSQLERAIWLGCARKYAVLLNGQNPMLITSLHYFTQLVEEVQATKVGDGYWRHVQRKVEELERRWMANRSTTPEKPDEIMETK